MNRPCSHFLIVITLGTAVLFAEISHAEDAVDFQAVADYLQLPEGLTLGACSAVDIDRKGRLYVFHRGKKPILCFDPNGKFLSGWGDDVIGKAHGLRVDSQGNIWVTDIGHHMVFQFSPQGKLLKGIGQFDKPGTGLDQFNQPTDIAFGPQGEIYVADGYGNSRIMKFSAEGRYLEHWGMRGKGQGEFHLPHSLVVDAKGRVLVGDRENNRIQVFDSQGKFLEVWPGFAPYGIELNPKGSLFVADGRANKILQLDSQGKIIRTWGKKGKAPGEFNMPHMLAADSDGNLYIAEVNGKRLQKLKIKP